ncbi:MAG TPA: hypothetical protein VGF52_00360 [Tepidisphaeraceae bacterium]|jgi:hypothetical protein
MIPAMRICFGPTAAGCEDAVEDDLLHPLKNMIPKIAMAAKPALSTDLPIVVPPRKPPPLPHFSRDMSSHVETFISPWIGHRCKQMNKNATAETHRRRDGRREEKYLN